MPTPTKAFLVTQSCPQPTPIELSTAQRALALACQRLSASGTPIQLLATTYQPAQQRWLGLCLADTDRAVHTATASAQLANIDVTEV